MCQYFSLQPELLGLSSLHIYDCGTTSIYKNVALPYSTDFVYRTTDYIPVEYNTRKYILDIDAIRAQIFDDNDRSTFSSYVQTFGLLTLFKLKPFQLLESQGTHKNTIASAYAHFESNKYSIMALPLGHRLDLTINKTLYSYTHIPNDVIVLLKPLGKGSFKNVFKIIEIFKSRISALFIPITDGKKDQKKTILSIHCESSIMDVFERCKIPYALRKCDLFILNTIPYLTVEYCHGGTLESLIGEKPLEYKQVVAYALQIAAFLKAIHAIKYTHNDIKPLNILLTRSGEIRVGDFGHTSKIVRSLKQKSYGTTKYAAPEFATSDISYKPEHDVYAFGLTLYEMRYSKKVDYKVLSLKGDKAFQFEDSLDILIKDLLAEDPKLRPTSLQAYLELEKLSSETSKSLQ